MRATRCYLTEFLDLQKVNNTKVTDLTQDPVALAALAKEPSGWCMHLMRNTRVCHLRG